MQRATPTRGRSGADRRAVTTQIRPRDHPAQPLGVIDRTSTPETGLDEDEGEFGGVEIGFTSVEECRPVDHGRGCALVGLNDRSDVGRRVAHV